MSAALAAAAGALEGCPWRLHGRDPATGLDCVGLLAAALAALGRHVSLPTGYSLRLCDPGHWMPDPATLGFEPALGSVEAGDVVLLRLGQAQVHLLIAGPGGGWVHAHAGLRRVVRQNQLPDGQMLGRWRLIS